MAQENNKNKPDLYDKGGGDKSPRRGPRFSIYWIYAISSNYFNCIIMFLILNKPDVQTTTEQEFKEQMLKDGDVAQNR